MNKKPHITYVKEGSVDGTRVRWMPRANGLRISDPEGPYYLAFHDNNQISDNLFQIAVELDFGLWYTRRTS